MSTINAVAPRFTTRSTDGADETNGAKGKGNADSVVAASAKDIEDRFLTLLVSQIKNQDPLNPLDNAQLTTQLAQISTVGGIDRMNQTLSAIQALLASQQKPTGSDGSGSNAANNTKAS